MNLIFHSKDENIPRKFTIVLTYEEGFDKVLCGLSICHKKDQFTKKLGVSIATGRSIRSPFKALPINYNLTEPEVKKELLVKGYELVNEVSDNLDLYISKKYELGVQPSE